MAVQLVHGRYLDGFVMSSKSVARSAGLRSIRRGRQVAAVFRRPRPDPADRSPGPFRSRPLVSSVSVQFVFHPFRFVASSSSLACSVQFRSFLFACSAWFVFPACSRFSGLLVCLSSSFLVPFRLVLSSSRSVPLGFRSDFVSFGFCSLELVLCSRLLACRFIYIILAYIIH